MGATNDDKILIMRAFGAEKRAADMLGAGPRGVQPPKSSAITNTTGPLAGQKALDSLIDSRRGVKTPEASINAQNAKKPEDEQEETEKKVEKLESASDTSPKKAPAKKPEEPSENEIEYKSASMQKRANAGFILKNMLRTGLGGGAIGGLYGLISPAEGEDRTTTAIRRALLGAGLGAGYAGAAGLASSATKPGRKGLELLEAMQKRLADSGPDVTDAITAQMHVGRHALKHPLETMIFPGLSGIAGGYGGYKGMQALQDKESAAPGSSLSKYAFFPGAIGAIYGATREKDPGESRMGSVGRSWVRDIGTQAGAGLGGGIGAGIGMATRNPLLMILGALLGGGAGGYGAYRGMRSLTKRPLEKKEDEEEAAKAEKEEKEAFDKSAYGGLGLPAGLISGLARDTEPGEDRGQAVGRGLARGWGSDIGSGLGALVGSIPGIAMEASPKLRGSNSSLVALILGALLGSGAGAYGGYRTAKSMTKSKGEKEDEKSSAARDRCIEKMAVTFPIGTAVGAMAGLARKKDPGEDRAQAVGRSALTGAGVDLGALVGGIGGAAGGDWLGKKLAPKRYTFDFERQSKQQNIQVMTAILGTLLGGGAGYLLSRRDPKEASVRRPFFKASAGYGEDKGLSTTSKLLIGALAGAGIPVALWHTSGPFVRRVIEKIYKAAPLEKLYNMPTTHPRLTKGLMYAPAAGGAAIGALSGGGDDEFKLSRIIDVQPIEKRAQPDMRQMAADEAPQDHIPLLGPLGGKVLGGLGSLTSGLGLPGVGSKLDEWSQNPTARSIAGGGTAAIAALLTALAARKLMRGREDEAEG